MVDMIDMIAFPGEYLMHCLRESPIYTILQSSKIYLKLTRAEDGLQITVYLILSVNFFSFRYSPLLWRFFPENNSVRQKRWERTLCDTGQNSDSISNSPSLSNRLLLKATQLSSLITSLLCNTKIDSTFSSGETTADLFFFFLSFCLKQIKEHFRQ